MSARAKERTATKWPQLEEVPFFDVDNNCEIMPLLTHRVQDQQVFAVSIRCRRVRCEFSDEP
jgi:hypothetical protein